jgi:hypothetical protein
VLTGTMGTPAVYAAEGQHQVLDGVAGEHHERPAGAQPAVEQRLRDRIRLLARRAASQLMLIHSSPARWAARTRPGCARAQARNAWAMLAA